MSKERQEGFGRDMPFASLTYFKAWIEAFGNSETGIWIPDDARGETAIAYVRAPLRLGPLRVSAVSGATNDHTARFDIVGNLDQPAQILGRMQKALGISLLQFDYLSHDGQLLKAVRENDRGLWYQVEFREESWQVNCRIPWEEYWLSRGTTRHLWLRREHKLSKLGATFRCLDDWQQIEPLLPAVLEVEASGWKGREGSAIGQSPHTMSFYSRCMRYWAEQGWLRLFLLDMNGEILAFQITVLHRGILYQLKVGYQDRHAKLSPGQVLQLLLLRWAFANPDVHAYDMLGGGGKAEANKKKWATGAETLYTLRFFRRNMGGLLAWLRFVIAPRVKSAIFPVRAAEATKSGEGREGGHRDTPESES